MNLYALVANCQKSDILLNFIFKRSRSVYIFQLLNFIIYTFIDNNLKQVLSKIPKKS